MSDVKLYTVHRSITTSFTVEVETDNPDFVRELAYKKVERDYGYFDEWDVEEITEGDE
jgi:hypothetical protein